MSSLRVKRDAQPPKPVVRQKSFQFINSDGNSTAAFYEEGSGAIQIAEAIFKENGGDCWPLQIDGESLEKFDWSNIEDMVHQIIWAPPKDPTRGKEVEVFKKQLREAIQKREQEIQKREQEEEIRKQEQEREISKSRPPAAQENIDLDKPREMFTERRAAEIEGLFNALISDCLENIDDTIGALNRKKIELLEEKARIEATIQALEGKIEYFKLDADDMIENLDPYEEDLQKLRSKPSSHAD